MTKGMVRRMKIRVYYEENPELNILNPVWLVVYFGREKFNWKAKRFFIELEAPFKRIKRGEMDIGENVMSFSVTIEDLVLDVLRPEGFLVDIQSMLLRIKKLHETQFFDHLDIDQFIIQMADIEDVMQMNISRYYDWGF
jgi:hypothetical protein